MRTDRSFQRRVLAALAMLLTGCAGPTPTGPAEGPVLVLPGAGAPTTRRDPAEIVDARLRGDTLQLQIRYGGGCAEHHFSLLHHGVWMESDPVQTELRLAHDARGDRCRALATRDVSFDLTPLRQAYQRTYGGPGGTVILHLHAPGPQQTAVAPLRYRF